MSPAVLSDAQWHPRPHLHHVASFSFRLAGVANEAHIQCLATIVGQGRTVFVDVTRKSITGARVTYEGTFATYEPGLFLPHCVLLHADLEKSGMDNSLLDTTLSPLNVTEAAEPRLGDYLLPLCGAGAGVSIGPGRWLPLAAARQEVLNGQALPSRYPFYWVPYLCRLTVYTAPPASCPALHRLAVAGDSVTGVLFTQLLNTVGYPDYTRDKAADHAAEKLRKSCLELSGHWKDAVKDLEWALESPSPCNASATSFGSLISSNYFRDPRPYWKGALPTLYNVNWGRHDLECGQRCFLGHKAPKSPAEYAADVGALVSDVMASGQHLVYRTLIPSFFESLCGMHQTWRWRGVDFHRGTASRSNVIIDARCSKVTSRFPRYEYAAYAAAQSELHSHLHGSVTARPPLNVALLDGWQIVASSPSSNSAFAEDYLHPAKGSVEGHVLSELLLNIACHHFSDAKLLDEESPAISHTSTIASS